MVPLQKYVPVFESSLSVVIAEILIPFPFNISGMSLDTAILRPVSPFLRLRMMETLSASNSTSKNENSRGNALVLHWYVLLIIIIVVIAVAVLFYRACCARSTNKRKLHGLINEVRAEALTK